MQAAATSGVEPALEGGHPFSATSQALICAATAAPPYEGACPCCGRTPVLGADGKPVRGAEFDHALHRALNRPEHGWLICRACHAELTTGGYLVRFSRLPEFRAFQGAVLAQKQQAKAGRHAPEA